jgi:hypothetical protein
MYTLSNGVHSTVVSVSPAQIPRARALSLAEAPALAWMAAVAAVADLLINRILLRSWEASWSREALVQLDRWGAFASNLTVMSGLVALGFCLATLASRRSGLSLSGRIGLAMFGGAFIPVVMLMTTMPRATTRPELVLMVAGLAHALMFFLILAGLRWRSAPALISILVLLLTATFCGLISLLVTLVGTQAFWAHTEQLANALRWCGEIAYLLLPIPVAFASGIPLHQRRGKLALVLGALLAMGWAFAMLYWRSSVGEDFATAVYGAFRLNFLPEDKVILYAVPLGAGWAVACAACLARAPERRLLGIALMLLLCAGYAPRTPTTLVISVLGIALVSRAALAVAHMRWPISSTEG